MSIWNWRPEPAHPLMHFACLVQHDATQPLPLLEAAASLGQDAAPDLDVQQVLCVVDNWVHRLNQRLDVEASQRTKLVALNRFFYDELGFAANVNDYVHPDNSYLHCVVQTRVGIPISLAVLWLELAAAIGLVAQGVSFPGHFLVKIPLEEGLVVQDPLTGQGLTLGVLGEWLEPFREAWHLKGEDMPPVHLFLQAADARLILERMLHNLRLSHTQRDDVVQHLNVLQRLLVLSPKDWVLYRDRGRLYASQGQRRAALEDLQTYLRHADAATDVLEVQDQVERLRTGSRLA